MIVKDALRDTARAIFALFGCCLVATVVTLFAKVQLCTYLELKPNGKLSINQSIL